MRMDSKNVWKEWVVDMDSQNEWWEWTVDMDIEIRQGGIYIEIRRGGIYNEIRQSIRMDSKNVWKE
jgi:hypothetical protein